MNKLLDPISWHTLFEGITIAAVAYYAFIAWKYYQPEIKKVIARISGQRDNDHQFPGVLLNQAQENDPYHSPQTIPGDQLPAYTGDQPISAIHSGPVRDLSRHLTDCIDAASEGPYDPPKLIAELKKILNDYPEVAATTDRDEVNALVVRECERTGTALLSESEVDLWWSA